MPLPLTTLHINRALEATPLPTPPTLNPPTLQVPRYRLNLLAAHNDLLYVPISRAHLAVYYINRANSIRLIPLPPIPITPNATINNVRIAHFRQHEPGHVLLMTGGHELSLQNGSLTSYRLPLSRSHLLQNPSPSAQTRHLPMRSAWGLAIHPPSGKVAISSNSYNVLVFNLCPSSPPTASAATPSPPIRLQDSQARLEASFEIRDAHLNNIPTLNFSPCGTMLSSASIDSTFAIYDMFDSGRLIYQSATPVPDAADPTRDTERCWITHWISQPVPVPVSAADPVWQAWLEQRGSTVRFVVPVDYAYVSPTRRSIFDRSDDRHVPFVDERSPDSSYDDTQPLEHQPVRPTMYKSTFATRRKEKRKRSTSHLESLAAPSQAQNETPLASGSVPSAHSFRWSGLSDDSDDSNLEHLPRHRRQPNEKDNNGMLMLVCREETISLCRVRRDLRDAPGATTSSSNDNPLRNQHVQMLDSIRISPKDITLRQVMYTNVIEVPQLSLLIVTAVSTGVILLRVMQPVLDPLLDGPGMLDISTNPVLLIERVITPEFDNVIGTCVVEREADTLAATSFELWILSQDGRIECWDISRGELAVDISARF